MSPQKQPPPAEKIVLYTIPEAVALGKAWGWPVTRRNLDKAVATGQLPVRKLPGCMDNQKKPRVKIEHEAYAFWLRNVLCPESGQGGAI
jgi:hypothetical protein